MNDYKTLKAGAIAALQNSQDPLTAVCVYLKNEIPHFNWVGFYFMNNKAQMLEIGPYAGEKTTHTRIPFGKGICGQVAVSGETFLSQDVSEEANYLACSIKTKAELVVPIYRGDELIGQIDIDSHHRNPFTKQDEELLQAVAEAVSKLQGLPI